LCQHEELLVSRFELLGELGLDEQSMLLRAIEEKKFLPVGSDAETESDFQLICGTNRDLQINVVNGCFREDLLSRIDLLTYQDITSN